MCSPWNLQSWTFTRIQCDTESIFRFESVCLEFLCLVLVIEDRFRFVFCHWGLGGDLPGFQQFFSFGEYLVGVVLGAIIVGFSLISCSATERGFCGTFTKALFLVVEVVLVIALFVVAGLNFREIASLNSADAFQKAEDDWKAIVGQAKEDPETLARTCLGLRLLDCNGWRDKQCVGCPGGSGCSEDLCVPCVPTFNATSGCYSVFREVVQNTAHGVRISSMVAAFIILLDAIAVFFLFPCFDVVDHDTWRIRKKPGLQGLDLDENRLPSWAERAEHIREFRKAPLILHTVISALLLVSNAESAWTMFYSAMSLTASPVISPGLGLCPLCSQSKWR